MFKLSVDRDKIDLAKRFAEQIVGPVQHIIDRHTTFSIEACVLRLLGVSGAAEASTDQAPQGRYPLVNRVLQAMGEDRLKRGAGYWFGLAALHHPDLDANALARQIAAGKIQWEALESAPMEKIDRVCQKFLKPQIDRLRKNREHKGKRPDWANRGGPLRYVIVATGNIHEDILQAQAAAEMGADIIAVIRSTAQSLLDYVPEGETIEGYGGTFATQANFRLMRQALDESEKKLKRRISLCNYSSGLCMPEIAVLGALEGVDYLLNDAMYGILFRDINMKRNFVDQYFSRRICTLSGITIQTGEDNYLTTADSYKYWFQVLASHFINQAFAKRAGISDGFLALGHAFEIDPQLEDSMLYEWAQAQLVRQIFPRAPIKFMPPTKHKTGDIFFSYLYDGMFNLAGMITGQTIQLLGMHTEAIHNPYIQDRYLSLKNADYVFRAAKSAKDEVLFQPNGKMARRARQVLDDAVRLLKKVRMRGLFRALEEGAFANVRRAQDGGKGLDGVLPKDRNYYTPLQSYLAPRLAREEGRGSRAASSGRRRSVSSRDSERSRKSSRKPSRTRSPASTPTKEKKPMQRRELAAKSDGKTKKVSTRRDASAKRGNAAADRPRRSGKNNAAKNHRMGPPAPSASGTDEAALQRRFHEEMLKREHGKKEPLKINSAPPKTKNTSKPQALPRRNLKSAEASEVSLPRRPLKAEPKQKDKVASDQKATQGAVSGEAQPLPRRSLKSRSESKGEAKQKAPISESKPKSDIKPLPRRVLKTEPPKEQDKPDPKGAKE